MSVDKDYCLSSFLAFRYVYENDKDFAPGLKHRTYTHPLESERVLVKNASEIDMNSETDMAPEGTFEDVVPDFVQDMSPEDDGSSFEEKDEPEEEV